MTTTPHRIVLLGPPGSGKGTQAVLISTHYKIPHISTGEMMRGAVAGGSELGKKIKSFIDVGNLVPDNLVIDVIRERLTQKDCEHGFLLDGFPRTLPQAKSLTALLISLKKPLTHVIEISVPENVLIDRIRKRGQEGSGRTDDNVEVATNRLRVYWEQTAPVTAYYQGIMEVDSLDGLGTVEEVQQRILGSLM